MKMLAQTIQISFSSYAADTIRIHTGETGREILFAPDMEITGDYSADFIVIKPDDTFVIAAATIADGKINVEIPEQAGAVAGAGHYILKIYDSGNVCIYSASGGFMVDDHLLTDGIIESVAEVYGYRFPQDFARIDDEATESGTTWSSEKIAEEISSATPDVIDDKNVLYDKTWSSEKISYELGQITGYDVYTTTEQPVGRWIDGRTIYEKTYVVNNVNSDNTYVVDSALKQADIVLLPRTSHIISCTGTYNTTFEGDISENVSSRVLTNSNGLCVTILGYNNLSTQLGNCTIYITARYVKNE